MKYNITYQFFILIFLSPSYYFHNYSFSILLHIYFDFNNKIFLSLLLFNFFFSYMFTSILIISNNLILYSFSTYYFSFVGVLINKDYYVLNLHVYFFLLRIKIINHLKRYKLIII